MGYNIQPFEDFSLKKVTTLGASLGGNDGDSTPLGANINRTLPYQVHGRPFSIIFENLSTADSGAGALTGFVKVQVSNKAYTDPSKKYHNATPLDYGRDTIREGMEAAGVIGQLETSLTAADFYTGWVDHPNQDATALSDLVQSGVFVGLAGFRWVRVVGCFSDGTTAGTDDQANNVFLKDDLEGILYHGGADHSGK